jgi:hypothetical protein
MGSGGNRPPEHFIQDYCAAKLIEDHRLVVTVETNSTKYEEWLGVAPDPDLGGFRLDLMIWDPSPDRDPDKAIPRALVEFKSECLVYHR